MTRQRGCHFCSAEAVRRKRFQDPTSRRGFVRYWLCAACYERVHEIVTVAEVEAFDEEKPLAGCIIGPVVRPAWHKYVYGGAKQPQHRRKNVS